MPTTKLNRAVPILRAQSSNISGMFKNVPKQINHMVQAEAAIHPAIIRVYEHIFNGGTIDQINHEDMIILILNPQIKKGSFTRKSGGTLYDRNIVYLNRVTGDVRLKTPAHWGNLDISEVEERLNDMEQNRLV